jgi:hypothetical protein
MGESGNINILIRATNEAAVSIPLMAVAIPLSSAELRHGTSRRCFIDLDDLADFATRLNHGERHVADGVRATPTVIGPFDPSHDWELYVCDGFAASGVSTTDGRFRRETRDNVKSRHKRVE